MTYLRFGRGMIDNIKGVLVRSRKCWASEKMRVSDRTEPNLCATYCPSTANGSPVAVREK